MRKVLRTFFITLILIIALAILGVRWYAQQNPKKVQQFLGCPSVEQVVDYQAISTRLDSMESKFDTISSKIDTILSTQSTLLTGETNKNENAKENTVDDTKSKNTDKGEKEKK